MFKLLRLCEPLYIDVFVLYFVFGQL